MTIPQAIAWFFGSLLVSNAVPHWVAAVMGRPFQSPFAKPPGEGLSSSKVNILWGGSNVVVGYLLLFHIGDFDVRNLVHAAVVFVPAFLISFQHARHFGRFHGGNPPNTPTA